jgi:dihydroxyacetone kinase-like protein
MGRIFAEQDYKQGDEVAVLVNGLGGTPLEELYIMFRRVSQLFDERGVKVKHVWLGEFATSMEMAGASISVLHLDDELEPLVAASANTPFFKHIAG